MKLKKIVVAHFMCLFFVTLSILDLFFLCSHFYLGFFAITASFFFFFLFRTFVLELTPLIPLLDIQNHVYINDSLIYISGSHSSLELQIHVSPSPVHPTALQTEQIQNR